MDIDPRRTLTQLFTHDIEQVNSFKARKDSVLGNHFHRHTVEFFYVTQGSLELTIEYLTGGSETARYNKGDLFVVYPNQNHIIKALTYLEFLTFLSIKFDKKSPDVWVK